MSCGQSFPGSLPPFPAFLTVNPNARLAAVHADVDVGFAPPTLEFGVASLLARLTGSVLAFPSHCRQVRFSSLMPRLLEVFAFSETNLKRSTRGARKRSPCTTTAQVVESQERILLRPKTVRPFDMVREFQSLIVNNSIFHIEKRVRNIYWEPMSQKELFTLSLYSKSYYLA